MQTIEEVVSVHASHIETVAPGLPASFSAACVPGDTIAQGDLYLTLVNGPPRGYVRVENPPRQLVPETGAGSHHRLSSLDGVELWAPVGWRVDADWDRLDGPCFRASLGVVVLHEPGHGHPHGPVTTPADVWVECGYQREWLVEERRERRALD